MAEYLLKNDLYDPETAQVLKAGTKVELGDDERTKGLLERGTIVEAGEGVTHTPTPSAFDQAKSDLAKQNAEGNTITIGGTATSTSSDGESTLTPPAAQPGVTALTPEQLAQDFQGAGAQSSPVVPPEQ